MVEGILVGVDGSESAAGALAAVARLARGEKTAVLVVHVTDRGKLVRSVHGPDSLTLQWETPPDAKALVDSAVSGLCATGVSATGQVYGQFDTVARELLDVARAAGCGLIALGTRGRGRVGASLLGSVVHSVIHIADVPVLVARSTAEANPDAFARIALAIDGSPASRRAIEVAAEVAQGTVSRVAVVHVWGSQRASWRRYVAGDVVVETDTAETAGGLVDEAVLALQARGVDASPAVQASTGNVARDILEVAESQDCELVIVGSRGRGTVPALMLGSTTYQLLHTAQLPVIVAR
jgi:nucleotide-binding universal stress UspA family protein